MIVLYIFLFILAFIIFLLLWILIAPFVIRINTITQTYFVQFWGLVKADIVPTDDFLIIKMTVVVFPFTIDPLKMKRRKKSGKKQKRKKDKSKKKKSSKSSKGSFRIIYRVVRQVFRSFHVKKGDICFDTGDAALNGRLVPLLSVLNDRFKIQTKINFDGRNYADIHIVNQLIIIGFYSIKMFILLRRNRKK